MKHIAFYIGVLGSGGIESTTISICKNIDHDKVIIDFILDSEEYLQNINYKRIIESNKGKILFLSHYSKNNINSKLRKGAALYNLLRANQYDAIHLHVSYPSSIFYAIFAKAGGCKKVYATSHAKSTSIKNRFFLFSQYISRLFLPVFIKKRYAVSIDAGNWCYGNYKFEVVPNGIDVDKFSFDKSHRALIRHKLEIADDDIVVGHIGRFAKDKNHQFLVDTYSQFMHTHPHSKLLLVGEGPLKQKIMSYCLEKGVSKNVIFQDFTSTPEHYLWAMDIFLFPSLAEGFGIVAIEAQASSLPIIASDNVPLETRISQLISYIPLDIDLWVSKIDATNFSRDKLIDKNALRRFDARKISKQFENDYLL